MSEKQPLDSDWSKFWKPWRVVARKTRKRGYIPRGCGLHGFQADPQLMEQWFGGLTDGIYQLMVSGPCGENGEVVYAGMIANCLKASLMDYAGFDSRLTKNINQSLEDNKLLHARVLLRSEAMAPDVQSLLKIYTTGSNRPKWNAKSRR